MFRLERCRFGIARFLLGLYIAVLANGVVFRHAHRLSDGTIICHAHPYKSSPGSQFPSHTHNLDELIWLNAFSNALYASPDALAWVAILAVVLTVGTRISVFTPSLYFFRHTAFQHRGPPIHLA